LTERKTIEILRRILDYFYDDEIKDWDEKNRPNDHIIDMRCVMNWLDTQPD